jgi:large subunit ribosomal protein L13
MKADIVVDAENAILGRLSSFSAKKLLLGKKIAVVNCEKAIITGNKDTTVARYKEYRVRGGSSLKGPHFPKSAERIVKRTIRGMLPNYRTGRGRDALKRIKCYVGVPPEFEKEKRMIVGEKSLFQSKSKMVRIKEVSKWKK